MKSNKGVTLALLTISIIVLLIIMAIIVNVSIKLIKEAELEDLKTNMLIIQAKAKVSLEEVHFEIANLDKEKDVDKINTIKSQKLLGEAIDNWGQDIENAASEIENYKEYYYLNNDILSSIGLNNQSISNGYYLVKYDLDNLTVEVANTNGYSEDGHIYYTLSELNNL